MTTPERLRRRQRIETFLVCVTIVLTVGGGIITAHRNNSQDACFADQFEALSKSLTVRSDLASQDTKNLNAVVVGVAAAKTPEDVRAVFATYLEQRKAIDAKREQTPIPPYPNGKCDG